MNTNTWDRRLRAIPGSHGLCARFGAGPACDDIVSYELTYWSPQGRFRTPAKSTRLLCDKHARSYIARHAGDVEIAAA